jgi:cytochrome c-type biogenesis protein CcmH
MTRTPVTLQRNARLLFSLATFALLLATLLLGAGALHAQDATPLPVEEDAQGAPGAAAPVRTVTPDDVNQVARELWCPLCSGVRLDACELKACDQMKDMIEIQLAEGQDLQTIKDYFVEQYGPQVLGEPPRSGFNWLAWILPFVAVVAGGVFLWTRARRMDPRSAGGPPVSGPAAPDDPYARKLEEELKRYD